MSAETELYSALSGLPALVALVGTRIYPDVIPEDIAMPAVVTARQGTEPVVSVSGTQFGEFAQMIISAWATTRTAAESVADQVEAALIASGNYAANRSGGYDDETGAFSVTIETTLFIAA